jgi:hypothetical protein
MEMKGRKHLGMDMINNISTCIVRCEKGIYGNGNIKPKNGRSEL